MVTDPFTPCDDIKTEEHIMRGVACSEWEDWYWSICRQTLSSVRSVALLPADNPVESTGLRLVSTLSRVVPKC